MLREYPSYPILAVSATTFNSEHAVLLIKRGKPPAMGQWALPGGVVKLGESPETALIREVYEECHIEILPVNINKVLSHVVKDDSERIQFHYIILNFFSVWKGGLPRPGSDAVEARWVDFYALAKYNLAEGIYETICSLQNKEGIQ